MSRLAGEYYAEMADVASQMAGLAAITVPPILRGETVVMGDPALRVPTHMPPDELGIEKVAQRLAPIAFGGLGVIAEVTTALRTIQHAIHPGVEDYDPAGIVYSSQAKRLLKAAVPTATIPGHMKRFLIDAVVPNELSDELQQAFAKTRSHSKFTELHWGVAYLRVFGELSSGSARAHVGSVARLAMRGRHDQDGRLEAIIHTATMTCLPFPENEATVASVAQQVADNAARVAMQRPTV